MDHLFNLAGDAGLEPTHVAVKVLCLTDLANSLCKCGERTGIRTPDTRLRRALLYPAELCTHIIYFGAGNEIRTRDFNLGKVALYH